jgi:hypothetical protein
VEIHPTAAAVPRECPRALIKFARISQESGVSRVRSKGSSFALGLAAAHRPSVLNDGDHDDKDEMSSYTYFEEAPPQ